MYIGKQKWKLFTFKVKVANYLFFEGNFWFASRFLKFSKGSDGKWQMFADKSASSTYSAGDDSNLLSTKVKSQGGFWYSTLFVTLVRKCTHYMKHNVTRFKN